MYPQNNLQAHRNLLRRTSLTVEKGVPKFVPHSLKATDSIAFQADKPNITKMETTKQTVTAEKRTEIMERILKSLNNGIRSPKSKKPREWLKSRALSIEATYAAFNSGQIHHHKPQSFKDELASTGFLTRSDVGTNMGQVPYTVFGLYSMIFPLRDGIGRVVNFYAIGVETNKTSYLNNEGIYPSYPHPLTKKLYITETLLDAATLLESKILDNRDAVIALHDKEMLPQHKEAIASLQQLEEIILIETSK
ncbi:MAG TPA: hypothetical protein VNY36_05985 [Bacteroidia bacterium]|jgi:hypothetical protein|nr:hypothetical protein [Bacteroidia bacterium]